MNTTTTDISDALAQWFEAGHSRMTLILVGDLAGSVLLVSDKRPEPPEAIVRQVISTVTGSVVERRERPISIEQLAADPDNGPALVHAVRARLAGAIAPPPICPRLPQNIRP
jgi:hypothetical protein